MQVVEAHKGSVYNKGQARVSSLQDQRLQSSGDCLFCEVQGACVLDWTWEWIGDACTGTQGAQGRLLGARARLLLAVGHGALPVASPSCLHTHSHTRQAVAVPRCTSRSLARPSPPASSGACTQAAPPQAPSGVSLLECC